MDIFSQLNDKQQQAVRATEGFVRVIAGAGSGKTKLLVSRYAYLVREAGIDTANILCVTFTNKAAAEMKQRIRALIGPECDTSLICTYHGFCARLIREDPHKLFLTKGFQILDSAQQKSMLEEIYRKYDLKLDHAGFESILRRIGQFKHDTAYVPRLFSPAPCRILDEIPDVDHRVMEDFLQRQKAIYALDFHDLISGALYLLENDAEIRDKWQNRLNYVMVDEFQDSSAREMRLVDILSGLYGNLMIVGDPDQNIYEWRGSDVKLLVDFDKAHDPTDTIFLNRNYRSTPQILACANTLIDHNQMRLKKELFTLSPAGAGVLHFHAKSDAAEGGFITERIRSLVREQGLTYSDIAVLYRAGFLSRTVEKALSENGIPYEILGGVKFWQRMEVLDALAYLRLIVLDDDLSFKRIVNKPRRRFGRSRLAELEAVRDSEPTIFSGEAPSLYETLKAHISAPAFRASDAADLISFVDGIRAALPGMRISELVRRVTAESGYEQYIRELGDEERLENLAEFKRIADEYEKSFGEDLSAEEFLRQAALQSDEDGGKPRDAVKLMTIHAAKGLEFPAVFVVGFSEGIFPSAKTIEERKKPGLEEERRLCYVALTRAERFLFLTDSEGASQNGQKKLPSRFLREIGRHNYERIGEIPEELEREARGYEQRIGFADDIPAVKAVGERVEHHLFGPGTVVGREEKRGSYIIKFDKLAMPRFISPDYFAPRPEAAAGSEAVPGAETQPDTRPSLPVPEPDTDRVLTDAAFEEMDAAPEEDAEDAAIPEVPPVPAVPAEPPVPPVPAELPKNRWPAKPPESSVPPEIRWPAEVKPTPDEAETPDESSHEEANTDDERKQALARLLEESENLWKRDDVPKDGWRCVGITDLGEPVGVCGMCGTQIIRYVHHMVHDHYSPLGVGCVCAGKMEGNPAAARTRENEFKKKQTRRRNFLAHPWRTSGKGNAFMKIKGHLLVLCEVRVRGGTVWRYALDNGFGRDSYPTREKAVEAAFEALDTVVYGG